MAAIIGVLGALAVGLTACGSSPATTTPPIGTTTSAPPSAPAAAADAACQKVAKLSDALKSASSYPATKAAAVARTIFDDALAAHHAEPAEYAPLALATDILMIDTVAHGSWKEKPSANLSQPGLTRAEEACTQLAVSGGLVASSTTTTTTGATTAP